MLHDFIKESARSIIWISYMIHDLFDAICAKVKELAEID